MSHFLALQGAAIAHSDNAARARERGPQGFLLCSLLLLPEAYMAWREPEIPRFIDENQVNTPWDGSRDCWGIDQVIAAIEKQRAEGYLSVLVS
ncbi:hypothetical protein HD806DRAFT_529593 [Xylariaceae sp. AK1471]|nr:hypothetical protein HD806DRAFT_529593 [Xylariaceae sp. AK1471]